MDKALMDLKALLEKEIEAINAKNDISVAELDRLDKAVDIIKDIETICAMKEYGDDYDEGNSFRRGRSMTTGQYMSRDNGGNGGGYSGYYPMYYDPQPSYNTPWGRGVSYSDHSDYPNRYEMRDNLRRMMANASSDKERTTIQQFLDNWRE